MRNDVALRRSGHVVTVGHSEAQAAVQFLMKENGLLAPPCFFPFFLVGVVDSLMNCSDAMTNYDSIFLMSDDCGEQRFPTDLTNAYQLRVILAAIGVFLDRKGCPRPVVLRTLLPLSSRSICISHCLVSKRAGTLPSKPIRSEW